MSCLDSINEQIQTRPSIAFLETCCSSWINVNLF